MRHLRWLDKTQHKNADKTQGYDKFLCYCGVHSGFPLYGLKESIKREIKDICPTCKILASLYEVDSA